MKKRLGILCVVVLVSVGAVAKEKSPESFPDSESNFQWVMQKLLDKYVDKNLTKEQLYRAATAGMVSSLNSGDEKWNKLLSPQELNEVQTDLSGKIIGIGVVMKFDEISGHGQVLSTTAGSPAEAAGLKPDDRIVSVDGKKFKGKPFTQLVEAVRGEAGKKVQLRVLRGDEILRIAVQRQSIPWTPVELEKLDSGAALLTIGFFNEQTPKLVEEKLAEFRRWGLRKLVVDVRGNQGGGFEQAVKVAGFFLPENKVVASTLNRDGKVETFRSSQSLVDKDVQILLLTDKETFCGGELFVAALKENRKVKSVGEATFGKWNTQSVETLPNHFAIKYTVQQFRSPQGNSFQGKGIPPDVEVALPAGMDLREMRARHEISKRVGLDPQLKAAWEWIKAT